MTRFHDRYVTRDEHVRELDAVQTEAAQRWWIVAAYSFSAGFIFTVGVVMAALTTGHR
jgi:hypothetical protein